MVGKLNMVFQDFQVDIDDSPEEIDGRLRERLEQVSASLAILEAKIPVLISAQLSEANDGVAGIIGRLMEPAATRIESAAALETQFANQLAGRLSMVGAASGEMFAGLLQKFPAPGVKFRVNPAQLAALRALDARIVPGEAAAISDVALPLVRVLSPDVPIFPGPLPGPIECDEFGDCQILIPLPPDGLPGFPPVDGRPPGVPGDGDGLPIPVPIPPGGPPPGTPPIAVPVPPGLPPGPTPPPPFPGQPPVGVPPPIILPPPGQPPFPPLPPGQPPICIPGQPPTSQCPDPPPVCPPPCPPPSVVVVPCPPDDGDGQRPPGLPRIDDDPLIIPGEPGIREVPAQCELDAYDPANIQPPDMSVIDPFHPFQTLWYGASFNLEEHIITQWQRFNQRSRAGLFRNIFDLGRVIAFSRASTGKIIIRIDQFVTSMVRSTGCTSPQFIGLILLKGLASFFGLFISGALSKFIRFLGYQTDSLCPIDFPDEVEATEAFIRGEIDERILRIWVEQNNHCWEPYRLIVAARMNRIEPLLAMQAWRRKILTDEQFDEQVRRAGFTDPWLAEMFEKLSVFVPPITDVVRFMVRDVEDPDIVEDFGLDFEFDKKWTGKSKEFGEFQGIDDETALRYWRAHWRLPSPTQLFEMFHRSRAKPEGDPLITTLDQVTTALQQDDILPFWIPRLIDTTFARLSRVDARRAFETGAIDEAALRRNFTKIGYEDADVDALVRWAQINKTRVVMGLPEMRLFRDGVLSRDAARVRLEETLLTPDEINNILNLIELRGSIRPLRRCVRAIRKRFLTGDLTVVEARVELFEAGMALVAIDKTIASFECEARARGKEFGASQLCKFLEEGTITNAEFVARLERLGWTEPDAMRILVSCATKINEKRRREAEKLAKQEAAALEKEKREMERERKQIERERATAAKNLARAARAKDNREKLLQRSSSRLSKDAEVSIEGATACISGVWTELTADTVLTADERVQTIVLAVEKLKPTSCDDFRLKALALGEALERFEEVTQGQLQVIGSQFGVNVG